MNNTQTTECRRLGVPEDMTNLTKEDLVELYENANYYLEDIEATLTAIRQEFMARLTAEGLDSEVVKDYTITRFKKLNLKEVPDQLANELGFLEEKKTYTKNTSIAKKLLESGTKISGAVYEEFVRIAKVREK